MADLYNHSISDGFIWWFICRVIMADLDNLSISDGFIWKYYL